MTLALALCGCGGMGRRHIRGMQKLKAAGRLSFELVAVCDLFPASAEEAADLAEELLGRRPTVHSDLAELRGIDGLIITTSPETHAELGVMAMQMGIHVMVEKPIDLTIPQARRLVETGRRTNRKVAVAENYRRDPMNRLARALIDAGAVGAPYLAIQSTSGGGERVAITPWRHRLAKGGIIMDMGIHYADLLEYYLGPVAQVVGMNGIIDHERVDAQGQRHPVDAEDITAGVARYQNGAIAHYLIDRAGRGDGHFVRMIHGTGGSLAIPRDRSGQPNRLVQRRNGRDEVIPEEEQLALVPDFALDDVTAALFGGERMSSYTMEFSDIDANLLGVEQADFVAAIAEDRDPEVSGEVGMRSLALVLGFLESELLGRIVSMDEILQSDHLPYQANIERGSRL
jgi:predicted dehydrogenase